MVGFRAPGYDSWQLRSIESLAADRPRDEVPALRMMMRMGELLDAKATREGEGEISEKDRLAADQAVFDAIAAMVAEPEGE